MIGMASWHPNATMAFRESDWGVLASLLCSSKYIVLELHALTQNVARESKPAVRRACS